MPTIKPVVSAFFKRVPAVEGELKRFHREQALARYLQKRSKRAQAAPRLAKGQTRRTKKHESRQTIACNRPRVRGRFVKTEEPVIFVNGVSSSPTTAMDTSTMNNALATAATEFGRTVSDGGGL